MAESRATSIKVAVLEGDYALLTKAGLPVPLGLQLQSGSLHLSKANWCVKASPKGFFLTLSWPAVAPISPAGGPRKAKQPSHKKRRRRRRRKRRSNCPVDKAKSLTGDPVLPPSRPTSSPRPPRSPSLN